ncbi:MAG: oligosaccharide flippase family protein [Nitrospirae bacterium]|nr:oligosaccharide flippase family protein [Nitrospirota bacterium]
MINKESQVKHGFLYLTPVVISNIIPLATMPVFTSILTKEDFGILALAQAYAIFVNGLTNFGMTNVYDRNFFQYREKKEASELLYSTLCFISCLFIVFLFLSYLFGPLASRFIIGSSEYADLLFWSYFSSTIVSLNSYFLTYFKNSEDAKSFVRYTLCNDILGTSLSLLMIVYFRIGVRGLIWGQLLAGLVVFFVLAIRFLRRVPFSLNGTILRDCLKLGFPLTPRIFLNVIASQFNKYMIRLLSTVGGVGIYSIGEKIAYIIFTYMIAIQNVFSPQVYKRMFEFGDKGGESIGRYLTPFLYISIAVALMISLFSEEVIYILTPESYHGAVDIIIVLSMFYSSMFFGKQPQLMFARKTFMTSILSLFSIGLTIVLNIPFIIKWGVIGAAWATLVSGLISGTITFIISQRYYEIKWEYGRICMIFFVFFGSSLFLILLRNFNIEYPLRLSLKCLSIAIFVYLGVRFKIVTRDNFTMLRRGLYPISTVRARS